jgi:hypothetical protein
MKNNYYYYVYYSYEEWGRGYIGKRKCICLPEKDKKYFGSFSDKTFKPTEKIILAIFNTEEEALICEVQLHDYYKVDVNPHFANRAKQTSAKFYFDSTGIIRSEKTRKKISGKNNPMFGKTHSKEARKKISEAAKNISDETRLKMSNAKRGKSSRRLGQTHSEKTRQRLSEIGKKLTGENNPFFGKTHSEETRRRISEALKNRHSLKSVK